LAFFVYSGVLLGWPLNGLSEEYIILFKFSIIQISLNIQNIITTNLKYFWIGYLGHKLSVIISYLHIYNVIITILLSVIVLINFTYIMCIFLYNLNIYDFIVNMILLIKVVKFDSVFNLINYINIESVFNIIKNLKFDLLFNLTNNINTDSVFNIIKNLKFNSVHNLTNNISIDSIFNIIKIFKELNLNSMYLYSTDVCSTNFNNLLNLRHHCDNPMIYGFAIEINPNLSQDINNFINLYNQVDSGNSSDASLSDNDSVSSRPSVSTGKTSPHVEREENALNNENLVIIQGDQVLPENLTDLDTILNDLQIRIEEGTVDIRRYDPTILPEELSNPTETYYDGFEANTEDNNINNNINNNIDTINNNNDNTNNDTNNINNDNLINGQSNKVPNNTPK
jgi:hypothetical protein